VVADIDADFEGEAECGSLDVEERNLMSRTVAKQADLVFVVSTPGIKGLHALVRIVGALLALGTPADRIVPVINRSPRNPRARAEIASALRDLLPEVGVAVPMHVPERRRLDDVLRDGVRLPAAMSDLLARAARGTLDRLADERVAVGAAQPVAVAPGSLGSWSGDESSSA
jgi:hypothetical protein